MLKCDKRKKRGCLCPSFSPFGTTPSMLFCLGLMLPPAGDAILASCSNETALRRVEVKRHRASPLDTACIEPVVFYVFS
jgi:hypothetical protein